MGTIQDYPCLFPQGGMVLWHIMVFILGCCVGSFLNVCIWRIPNGIPLSMPPSHCPHCKKRIRWYHNIPLISWLALRAKCADCAQPVPARYFIVEALCGILFYLLWLKALTDAMPLAQLLLFATVTAFITAIAFIDLDHRLIPDKLTYPLILLGLAAAPLTRQLWNASGSFAAFMMALASAIAAALIMSSFAIAGKMVFKQEALGWGDVKYVTAIAACMGWRSAFFTLLLGSLAGSAAGIVMMTKSGQRLKTTIPFGPFLAGGTYCWMLFSDRIQQFIANLFPL